ncbi:tryptophan synthase subunit alpha [bacterium]|jgi:tryptophan synthase alpha chain|nr:tryptophan synthase subunit alpha [bacterium]MDG1892116.1 tryptophan synthase subunit alpha [Verrucomicrobiota bacterium]
MNRIEQRFEALRNEGRKGLVVYIGAGDPDLEATRSLALAFDKAGTDVLELGIPFSDPLADGPVNQLAAQRGLDSGTTPVNVLETVRAIRRDSQIPIVFFVYYNLLHRYGLESFIKDSSQAGVDGILILDLPPEESEDYSDLMCASGMCPVFLVAPTTPKERIAAIVKHGRGFIYYVSREGVTGMQTQISAGIGGMTSSIKEQTDLPIAVGFGISNPDQAKEVASMGDAIVVGSAVVHRIGQHGASEQMIPEVAGFVQSLSEAIQEVNVSSP